MCVGMFLIYLVSVKLRIMSGVLHLSTSQYFIFMLKLEFKIVGKFECAMYAEYLIINLTNFKK